MLSKHLRAQFPDITSFGSYNICQLYILVHNYVSITGMTFLQMAFQYLVW